MTTTEKIEARIVRAFATAPAESTVTEIVRGAAWDAVVEARGLGWTPVQQSGLAFAFAEIGADIVAAGLVAAGGAS